MKIKTFEGACKALKLNSKLLPKVSHLPKEHRAGLIAHYKLVIIAQALNDGWKPNWKDSNEYKYYPWFYYANKGKRSGFGFTRTDYDYSSTHTYVGSRLVFKSRELAEYAGKKFVKLYNQYLNN